ncbi:MAG: cyclic nucleotide-binding domain-containing protein [Bacteriovoracaceae bacterium]|jgi:CRP/FNR family transcriptional regulator, cyclic AMP receptor protein|nr:cyclic nucleotide-binding domain-containing protein [Bacteriovoracaceae bacterium]
MSYENDIDKSIKNSSELPEKLDIGLLKYFWQSSPITGRSGNNVPKFLREIDVLKNFTDNELRVLSKSMHKRNFSDSEFIFKQKETGIGLYFVYQGLVDVIVEGQQSARREGDKIEEDNIIITLDKYDYFGELALLQKTSIRNATAVARDKTVLLGIFKPDVEHLIESHPVIATKLIQSISVIIANRLFTVTQELKKLKHKIVKLEIECEKNKAE